MNLQINNEPILHPEQERNTWCLNDNSIYQLKDDSQTNKL